MSAMVIILILLVLGVVFLFKTASSTNNGVTDLIEKIVSRLDYLNSIEECDELLKEIEKVYRRSYPPKKELVYYYYMIVGMRNMIKREL